MSEATGATDGDSLVGRYVHATGNNYGEPFEVKGTVTAQGGLTRSVKIVTAAREIYYARASNVTVIDRPALLSPARHDIALNDPDGPVCDCGRQCADMAEWHRHTVETYNDPGLSAVKARGRSVHTVITIPADMAIPIERCTKVACYGAGNGGECWHTGLFVDPDSGSGRKVGLYGFPSEAAAREILARGATLSRTYTMNVC